jgi:molecular chaperone HtpG
MSDTVQPYRCGSRPRSRSRRQLALQGARDIPSRLVSNASDACDKLRNASLSQPELWGTDTELRIEIFADPDAGHLTVR